MQKFRKLRIWQKSINFISEIYLLSKSFPDFELFGLVSQIRRAAVSVSLNIAEGSGSHSDIEFRRFLIMSLRSIYEVMSALEISKKLNYANEEKINELLNKSDELAAMICGFIKKLKADCR